MASDASRRIVAELWQRPPNDTLSLEEWRYAASAAERRAWPPELRAATVVAGGVAAEWSWLVPGGDAEGPVVMVFHGGGYIVCNIGTHRLLGAQVAAAAGGRALVVGYRLAPEHPFPAAVEDCTAAYRWLLEEGVDAKRIVFFGDSAGGNLCATATLLARQQGLPLPAALVLASPGPDLTFTGASNRSKRDVDPFSRIDNPPRMLEYYLAGHDPTDPLVSSVYADLTGFPPMLVLVGPDETHLDDSAALVERAAAAGVDATLEIVPGAFHTWLGYAGVVPEAGASITRIGKFIVEQTKVR